MTIALIPVFLDAARARVLVTGSSPHVLDVARRLAASGADVRVVSCDADDAGEVSVEGAPLSCEAPGPQHLAEVTLLVAGSAHAEDDAAVVDAARRRGIPVVTGGRAGGTAWIGEAAGRGRVAVAVSTRGACAPLEARLAAAAVEALEPETDELVGILEGIAEKLEARFPDPERRAAIWEQVLDSPVLVLLRSGAHDDAREMAERMAWGTG